MTSPCQACGAPMSSGAAACPACGASAPTLVTPPGGAAPSTIVQSADVGARLGTALGGAYEIRRLVGRGGFAEVYEVWDRGLERRLAVKVLRPDLHWTEGTVQRFQREARAIAGLRHPGILPVYFVGEGQGLTWYAMPFVDGETLAELVKRGPVPPEQAVSLALGVLEALGYAHAEGVVHRDIKPDNVMVERATGRAVLVDFGIARRLEAGPGITQSGFVVGTPTYMSPEQALGQPDVDHRADIYAFGAVLYHLLTGEPPYVGDSSQEVVGKHLNAPVPDPRALASRVPAWLAAVVARCLAKRANERFQSTAEVADALRRGTAGAPMLPVPPVVPPPAAGAPPAAPAAPVEAAAPAGAPIAAEAPPAVPAPPRRRAPLVAALLLLAAVAAGWRLTQPRVLVTNRLALPIGVVIDGGAEVRLAPGATHRAAARRGRPLEVHWYAIAPKNDAGQPAGRDAQGSVSAPRARGTTRVEARADRLADPLFVPLVTNNTGVPLSFRVNAGSLDVTSCNCTVPPGAVRQPIGFFPLYRNSTVQAITPDGRTATFRDLGPEVDPVSGGVALRFNPTDLR